MAQVNLHTNPEFEAEFAALMKARDFRNKSQAIRQAVHEAAASYLPPVPRDLSPLIGWLERLPGNPRIDQTSAQVLHELDAEMERKLKGAGDR